MANWSGGVLTAAGRILQAKVEAGAALKITRLKIGDGVETLADVDPMVDLRNTRYVMGVSSRTANNGVCTISGIVLSEKVSTGFYAREFGVFAEDPDVGEILYSIMIDPIPDFVPPVTASVLTSAEFALDIAISNASAVKIMIDPNGLVTTDMLYDAAWLIRREYQYMEGDVVYTSQLRPGWYLKCIRSGKTSSLEIDLSNVKLMDTIADGTVAWQLTKVQTMDTDNFHIFKRVSDKKAILRLDKLIDGTVDSGGSSSGSGPNKPSPDSGYATDDDILSLFGK